MTKLLDRQTNLLRHLTSQAFIFGTAQLGAIAEEPELRGMDIRRLRLEAEFSYNKRIKRIRQTFGRTAALLGHGFPAIAREFASSHPPETYERYPDARCFFDHFIEHWAGKPPTPAWAADTAAVELALSRVRTLRPTAMETAAMAACPTQTSSSCYRTHPCAVLVRCEHDVRPLFEPGRSGQPVKRKRVFLAVLASRVQRRPTVMELAPEAFTLLELSTEWSQPGPERNALVERLAAQGLVLVCGNDAGDGNNG